MWNPNSLMELKLKSTVCHLPRDFNWDLFPSSAVKISLPPDQNQPSGHRCRLVTYRGGTQREEGWCTGEELTMPCAGPAAGLPERESSSPRATAGSSGKPDRASSHRAGACWAGQAPAPVLGEGPNGRAASPAFQPPVAPRWASRRQREGRRPGAICRAPPAAPGCPSCRGCAWPGRARAAWRGPAPRSEPPARTWRGC